MQDGDRGHTPEQAEAATSNPLFDMEPVIGDIGSFIHIIGHLCSSAGEVQEDEWRAVESRLIALHQELEELWNAAFEERKREREAHEAALAAAKAHMAPGSQAEVEYVRSLWKFMAYIASVMQDRVREVMPELAQTIAPASAGSGRA